MMTLEMVSDAEKQRVWDAYRNRRPIRVPMSLGANERAVLLDPRFNELGFDFRRAMADPEAHALAQLHLARWARTTLSAYTDQPGEFPDLWTVSPNPMNTFESEFFGAEVELEAGQVPGTAPVFDESSRDELPKADVSRPEENPAVRRWDAFAAELAKATADMRFEGRPVKAESFKRGFTDGPVTMGCNLMGSDFLMELAADPDFAEAAMSKLMEAAIAVRRMSLERGMPAGAMWMADDSAAMLSAEMFREQVLPLHRRWYEQAPADATRGMHLCGDAGHLFPTIVSELGVSELDTGYPIDFAALRAAVGPDVEIQGGVEIALLLQGRPEEVYARGREILESGVTEGGRFIFREANNLPPNVPLENLEAMRRANLDFGWY